MSDGQDKAVMRHDDDDDDDDDNDDVDDIDDQSLGFLTKSPSGI